MLAKAAIREGAEIMFAADSVEVDVTNCVVVLADGRRLEADLIVGADGNLTPWLTQPLQERFLTNPPAGMRSVVRASIPATASVSPKEFPEFCYRCTVPKSEMRNNPKVQWLLESGNGMS